jgi:hypothetical protein
MTPQQFETLLPFAKTWAEGQERIILDSGVPLTESQVADARKVGVVNPERVRLLRVPKIPVPADSGLAAAAAEIRLISPATEGLTVGYGIFIRDDCWLDRRLVVHELVHTLQHERLGGLPEFLRAYLWECITVGYPNGPMEQEAITTAQRLCA